MTRVQILRLLDHHLSFIYILGKALLLPHINWRCFECLFDTFDRVRPRAPRILNFTLYNMHDYVGWMEHPVARDGFHSRNVWTSQKPGASVWHGRLKPTIAKAHTYFPPRSRQAVSAKGCDLYRRFVTARNLSRKRPLSQSVGANKQVGLLQQTCSFCNPPPPHTSPPPRPACVYSGNRKEMWDERSRGLTGQRTLLQVKLTI